ncbi:MAG: bifunctional phosphopantothenoylcysteine decarboxylase/phosphopantothenate--cysteine ligase CoaBC, partial [Desulfobacterales bacterium]|nr:bifunctional phosphopantothenoylcysteine decarboxylase/phosphopantothenate--cysteine ligase CoaBC [Desulfobacterales bacterium]
GPRIEEGKAKIAEVKDVVSAVIRKLAVAKDLVGKRVLVTAGPTLEYIDPIRIITNKSSGKMGVAIAEEAMLRGAEVTLIYGSGTVSPPLGVRVINVETTEDMYNAVMAELKSSKYDVMMAAGAAADFAPERPIKHKVPTRTTPELFLKLKSTPKIIDIVKKVSPSTFLAAFKAEYGLSDKELIKSAHHRLKSANADLVVANDVSRNAVGFKVDTNEVFIVDKDGSVVHIPLTTKREVAKKLLDIIVKKLSYN